MIIEFYNHLIQVTMLTNQSIGYIDAPIPKGLDLKEEINRMRREKNAVILAHYYQTGDIQDIGS